MEQTEQLKASALMLDMGVAIPVRPFKFLYRKKKPRSVVMRTSGLGNLMRISNLHLQMGITYADLDRYLLTGEGEAATIEKIERYHGRSEHKRRPAATYSN